MSTKSKDNYPKAAKKHLEDAMILFIEGRFTNSAYLVGYVYECILKTFIQLDNIQTKGKHDLSKLSKEVLSFAKITGTKTAKYHNSFKFNTLLYDKHNRFGGWSENIRYFPEDSIDETKADEWYTNAENFYNASILQMQLDGLI